MAEGKPPLSVGFWFSLGHSTVAIGLARTVAAHISPVLAAGGAAR
jgi:high-affinity nickel permease